MSVPGSLAGPEHIPSKTIPHAQFQAIFGECLDLALVLNLHRLKTPDLNPIPSHSWGVCTMKFTQIGAVSDLMHKDPIFLSSVTWPQSLWITDLNGHQRKFLILISSMIFNFSASTWTNDLSFLISRALCLYSCPSFCSQCLMAQVVFGQGYS